MVPLSTSLPWELLIRQGGGERTKLGGGVLVDVTTDEILARGLSMPHSPRWYRDRLWVLESGEGSLATVDLSSGKVETVIQLPGFTRGLDFYGPLAFIGLSQVRESAVFSGIPLTDRITDRSCGVWVVNIDRAEIVAFLGFEDAVQEVFAVQVLPGIRFPELVIENNDFIKSSYVLPEEALAQVQLSNAPLSEAERAFLAGMKAYQAGQLKVAVEHYFRGLELRPQQMTARYQLGVILVDLERWQEGIEQLSQVVAERSDHVEAHNSLGVAHLKLEDLDKAQWHFERALALNPRFELARNNLQVLKQLISSQQPSQ